VGSELHMRLQTPEILCFVQTSKAHQAGDISRPIAVETNQLLAECPPNVGTGKKDYPVATFIEPLEYTWTEEGYEAQMAAKRYIEENHAHP
jgi:hypothetical protein